MLGECDSLLAMGSGKSPAKVRGPERRPCLTGRHSIQETERNKSPTLLPPAAAPTGGTAAGERDQGKPLPSRLPWTPAMHPTCPPDASFWGNMREQKSEPGSSGRHPAPAPLRQILHWLTENPPYNPRSSPFYEGGNKLWRGGQEHPESKR